MAPKKSEMKAILEGIEAQVGNKKKPRLMMATDVKAETLITFGVPSIDAASNAGGHPRGCIMEIFGPESSGKSYTAYKLITAYQALGMHALLLDVENAYWPSWVAKAGVDLSRLIIGQDFESGEQAMMYAQAAANSKQFGIIVIDSIASLLPQSEADSKLDANARVGAHAAMMSRCLRQLKGDMSRTDTTLICVNQTRNKIGVMFGNPEDTPGGKALKFYADMRIGLQFIGKEMAKIDGVDKPVGIRTKIRFVKNKVGQPFGEDEFVIYHVDGINTPMVQLVNLAIRLRVVNRKAFDEEDVKKKTFSWKDANGQPEDTECTTASDLADWFEAQDLVPKVVELVLEKAKGKDIDIPPEVVKLKDPVVEDSSEAAKTE